MYVHTGQRLPAFSKLEGEDWGRFTLQPALPPCPAGRHGGSPLREAGGQLAVGRIFTESFEVIGLMTNSSCPEANLARLGRPLKEGLRTE